jgi:predicted DNA-binding transcriptional regulator AlpA
MVQTMNRPALSQTESSLAGGQRSIRGGPVIQPRGLRRNIAALYVGVSPSKFDDWVSRRIMPHAKRIYGVTVWDRYELDQAFTALSDPNESDQDDIWSRVGS